MSKFKRIIEEFREEYQIDEQMLWFLSVLAGVCFTVIALTLLC